MDSFGQEIAEAIPALRRYARALTHNAETADDLVQDTLLRALRSQHLFHGGEMRSWLYTILTNLNRNRLRAGPGGVRRQYRREARRASRLSPVQS